MKDVMRNNFTPLTEKQKIAVNEIKMKFNALHEFIEHYGSIAKVEVKREIALSKTQLEQACMWAVKAFTTEGSL